MAYGIEIKNSSNETILDGTSPVYTEVASGTLAVDNPNWGSGGIEGAYRGIINVPTAYSGDSTVFAYTLPVGRWVSLWKDTVYALRSEGSTSVPYKVFAPLDIVSSSGDAYGLQIFNVSGALVFDSGRTTFNVVSNHLFTNEIPQTIAYRNPGNKWVSVTTGGNKGLVRLGSVNGSVVTGYGRVVTGYVRQNSDGTVSAKVLEYMSGPFPTNSDVGSGTTCNAVIMEIT